MAKLKKSRWHKLSLFLAVMGLAVASPFTVYADDYDYIPISDIDQYGAYKFWELYGYQLDYTNTISYNQVSTGTFQWTGTLHSTSLGSESGSMNITVTGTSTSLNGEGGTLSSYNAIHSVDGLTIEMTSNDPTYQYNQAPFTCYTENTAIQGDDHFVNQWGCRPTAGQTASFEPPEYELVVQPSENYVSEAQSVGELYITLSERGDGGGTYSGSISLNETGSQSGSGTISLNGTNSTTGHKVYDIPILTLKNGTIDNTFKRGKGITCDAANLNPVVICFLQNDAPFKNLKNYITVKKISDNSINTGAIITNKGLTYMGGFSINTIEIAGIYDYSYLDINYNYPSVIPIYVGNKNRMPDDLYRFIYMSDRTDELIDSGTSQSQQAASNVSSETSALTDSSNDLHTFENEQKENLNSSLDDIDIDNASIKTNGFIASANWIVNQFNWIVDPEPLRKVLIFILTVGIALTILGKLRNR